jgi:hypothetical protein
VTQMVLQFVFYENGEIMVWGEDFHGGVAIQVASDWAQFGPAKYVANDDRTGLAVRVGWTDPEPEA